LSSSSVAMLTLKTEISRDAERHQIRPARGTPERLAGLIASHPEVANGLARTVRKFSGQ
jgi:hypothetical protein